MGLKISSANPLYYSGLYTGNIRKANKNKEKWHFFSSFICNLIKKDYITESSHIVPEWRNGRRSRLKICRWRHRKGSSPFFGTTFTLNFYTFAPYLPHRSCKSLFCMLSFSATNQYGWSRHEVWQWIRSSLKSKWFWIHFPNKFLAAVSVNGMDIKDAGKRLRSNYDGFAFMGKHDIFMPGNGFLFGRICGP